MTWQIPGTTLQVQDQTPEQIEGLFSSMFLAGGMVLSQVASLTGLEAYTIQNWVKRGFLSPPERKKYSCNQLCRIITINMLRSALSLEQICGLLTYVNGDLDDTSDDIIDDGKLYFLFIRLAAYHRVMNNPQGRDAYLQQVLQSYAEPVPGARERVEKVLKIMLTAWAASQLRQSAEAMIRQL